MTAPGKNYLNTASTRLAMQSCSPFLSGLAHREEAPWISEEMGEDFDFEGTIRGIHAELQELNAEAVERRGELPGILRNWGYNLAGN